MEMLVDFPGGDKVEARFGGFSVRTDQPPQGGGEASAPTPFELFLASLATCAGIYALRFCRRRGLSTEGLVIKQHSEQSRATGMVEKVTLEVVLPGGFPAKYREALINAIELCTVKKHLEQPPAFEITTT
jgi:ribosomal protein S12 methylthiotransferase accessory factor